MLVASESLFSDTTTLGLRVQILGHRKRVDNHNILSEVNIWYMKKCSVS